MKAEEKFEPVTMTIFTAFDYILIKQWKTRAVNWLGNTKRKVYLYDENRYRLYNGIFFEVSVNGATPNNNRTIKKEWFCFNLIKLLT
jgi:hypothetical protein